MQLTLDSEIIDNETKYYLLLEEETIKLLLETLERIKNWSLQRDLA